MDDAVAEPTFESRARGLLVGLALGESLGSGDAPTGTLHAGASTQLAAWSAEAMLRDRGRPTLVQLTAATRRWASARREPAVLDGCGVPGWLSRTDVVARRRGSSPSTLAAAVSRNPVRSDGYQALMRVLPLAIKLQAPEGSWGSDRKWAETFVQEAASLTHDDGTRNEPAGVAVRLLHHAMSAAYWKVAIGNTFNTEGTPSQRSIHEAYLDGLTRGGEVQVLHRWAPDRSARSALDGGVYVVSTHAVQGSGPPSPTAVAAAFDLALSAPHPKSVAAISGALLGALHGIEVLPVELVARLDLSWVMDTLARDLVAALEGRANRDPWWETKYPSG